MSETTYFRAGLYPDDEGLTVSFSEYVSIHETPSYSFCVARGDLSRVKAYSGFNKTTAIQAAKQIKAVKLTRIHKGCSRFAFKTKEEALKNLKFRKARQIKHLNRELEFAKAFLEKAPSMEALTNETHSYGGLCWHVVPDTRDLVHQFIIFDY